jgi:hypothetical protein
VEKYLLSRGLILKASGPEDLERITRNAAINHNYAAKQLRKATRAVKEMEDPIEKLLSLLTDEDNIIKLRTDTKNAREAR